MTDIIAPIGAAGIGTVMLVPMPDVEPFSIRSGYSFEGILSDIRTWLRDVLVPYLLDTSPQTIFQQNVDTMTNTVNTALSQQSATVTAALNAAVNEVIAGAIPVEDGLVLAVLEDLASNTRKFLDGYTFRAPAPNGTNDTAAVQPLIDAAMSASGIGSGPGVVELQAGTYKGNFTVNAGFWAPIIRGKGFQATYLQSADATKPVFSVTGSAGALSSGALEDVTLAGTDITTTSARNGIGSQVDGVGGFTFRRVQFLNLAKGHRWVIGAAGDFTEFVVLEDCVWNGVTLPCEYAGAGSYHGSGVDGRSVVNLDPGAEFMEIGTGCNVYSAPLSVTVFAPVGSATGNVIVNRYAAPVFFHGCLRMEEQGGEYTLAWEAGSNVYLAGEVMMWGGPTHMGRLFLVDKVVSTGGNILMQLKPWSTKQTLNTGVTPIMGGAPINGPGTYDASVDVVGPGGYWYSADVRCWASGTSVPATIDVVREHYVNDPGSVGKPTFTWDAAGGTGLNISQNNFNTNYSASSTFRAMVHANAGDNLGQF